MSDTDTQKRVNEIVKRVLRNQTQKRDAQNGVAGARERLAMDVMNTGGAAGDDLSHAVMVRNQTSHLFHHNGIVTPAARGCLDGSWIQKESGSSNIVLQNPDNEDHRCSIGRERTKNKRKDKAGNIVSEDTVYQTRMKLDVGVKFIQSKDLLGGSKSSALNASVDIRDFLNAQATLIQELLTS